MLHSPHFVVVSIREKNWNLKVFVLASPKLEGSWRGAACLSFKPRHNNFANKNVNAQVTIKSVKHSRSFIRIKLFFSFVEKLKKVCLWPPRETAFPSMKFHRSSLFFGRTFHDWLKGLSFISLKIDLFEETLLSVWNCCVCVYFFAVYKVTTLMFFHGLANLQHFGVVQLQMKK